MAKKEPTTKKEEVLRYEKTFTVRCWVEPATYGRNLSGLAEALTALANLEASNVENAIDQSLDATISMACSQM